MINFALKKGYSDKETRTLLIFSILKNTCKINYFNKYSEVPENMIPVGNIDWVTSILGFIPKPDFYPFFLKKYLYRKV